MVDILTMCINDLKVKSALQKIVYQLNITEDLKNNINNKVHPNKDFLNGHRYIKIITYCLYIICHEECKKLAMLKKNDWIISFFQYLYDVLMCMGKRSNKLN